MVRGIAEPLCAIYTAAYLARVGFGIDSNQKDYLLLLVDFCFKMLDKAQKDGNSKCADHDQYISLFEPSVDWIF